MKGSLLHISPETKSVHAIHISAGTYQSIIHQCSANVHIGLGTYHPISRQYIWVLVHISHNSLIHMGSGTYQSIIYQYMNLLKERNLGHLATRGEIIPIQVKPILMGTAHSAAPHYELSASFPIYKIYFIRGKVSDV